MVFIGKLNDITRIPRLLNVLKKKRNMSYVFKRAYNILFYGGQWYKYDDFKLQIEYLIKNNKSFLNISEK